MGAAASAARTFGHGSAVRWLAGVRCDAAGRSPRQRRRACGRCAAPAHCASLRQAPADDVVDDRQDEEHLEGLGQQLVVDLVRREGELRHVDHVAQRRLLDRRDELAEHARHHVVERLRQDHVPHRAEVAVAERARGLHLALGQAPRCRRARPRTDRRPRRSPACTASSRSPRRCGRSAAAPGSRPTGSASAAARRAPRRPAQSTASAAGASATAAPAPAAR